MLYLQRHQREPGQQTTQGREGRTERMASWEGRTATVQAGSRAGWSRGQREVSGRLGRQAGPASTLTPAFVGCSESPHPSPDFALRAMDKQGSVCSRST